MVADLHHALWIDAIEALRAVFPVLRSAPWLRPVLRAVTLSNPVPESAVHTAAATPQFVVPPGSHVRWPWSPTSVAQRDRSSGVADEYEAGHVDAVSVVPTVGLWLQRSCSFGRHRCTSSDWNSRSFATYVGNAHIVPVEASKYKQKSVSDFLQDLSMGC